MLEDDLFEKDCTRIGAEQEFCLIDYSLLPCMKAMEMLEHLNDRHFTTELARFNLELNLDPQEFKDHCFSTLENDLVNHLVKANKTAHALGAKIILTGILPTLSKDDISIENITPRDRYLKLNEAILSERASSFRFHISGIDELLDHHENILYESCNTSFQAHFQIDPEKAVSLYNWAHAISGPVLAACTNSPLFLGKRLWRETRIALFQQSADTRKSVSPYREQQERVSFGTDWEQKSAVNIFREIVQHHPILLPLNIEQDALETLKHGEIPTLKALSIHNGTIYRWNRLCYGITQNVPHLRIENRYMPSGPTIVDEIANTAFWAGLMNAMPVEYQNLPATMSFADARNNFFFAAKAGLNAQFTWVNEQLITAQNLILNELLPIARSGLLDAGVVESDISKYLGIIEERVQQRQTGSQWILDSYNRLAKKVGDQEAAVTITEGIYRRQKRGMPVHTWSKLRREEGGGWRNRFRFVKQLMSKDLITLKPDDLLVLANNIMLWSNIHHIPVESNSGKLLGLLSADRIMMLTAEKTREEIEGITVEELMARDVPTVTPDTRTRVAFQLMGNHELSCIPVVHDSRLVGIITKNDFLRLLGHFFEEVSEKDNPSSGE